MQVTDEGTYVEVDGRPAVRFERIYPHPVERVWRAVTDPDELRGWFPSPEVTIEPREGGTITMAGDPYAPEASTSRVLVWDPPSRFSFEWDGDELHLTLAPHEDGCRLTFVNVLATEGSAARNAAGWEVCLRSLGEVLAGRPGGDQHGSMEEFRPMLERYKAAGMPDDGWLPEEP
ncbi:SRPBCC family protein [Nocardioides caldifontis]|uniref:SRPBCC family protein n=1 Tax=Nocardioides caldifontis TaxID=2588938 RepID=UPI0011E05BD4|nr:SRPBCC family protein [Nocardioides caldifontis]